ncbi:MAG: outer membrane beta-barrel protein [Deltaproteobacteria bacterium]|jgi:hypothetical protein|nr:outer membrane beta-barrel protein [Deltaproteobacteria bacterium]
MKKSNLILLTFAVSLFAVIPHTFAEGNEVTVSPYVSTKLSFGWTKGHNAVGDLSSDDGYETSFDTNTDTGVGTKIAVGVSTAVPAIHGAIRTELEFGLNSDYKDKNVDTSYVDDGYPSFTVESKTFLFNVYYDFTNCSKFTPYIGAGLGLAHTTLDMNYFGDDGGNDWYAGGSKTNNKFAWQVGTGVAYNITDKTALDLGYRFTDLGEISADADRNSNPGAVKADLKSHEILLGLRYTF